MLKATIIGQPWVQPQQQKIVLYQNEITRDHIEPKIKVCKESIKSSSFIWTCPGGIELQHFVLTGFTGVSPSAPVAAGVESFVDLFDVDDDEAVDSTGDVSLLR